MAVIIILLIILIMIYLLQRLRFKLLINLSDKDISANIFCIYPLLNIRIELENSRPLLYVYVFKIRVYKKQLRKRNEIRHKASLLRYIKFEDLKVCTYYGLKDPFSTGILSGLLGIVKMYAVPVQITQYPDFFTTNEYLRIDASGYIKLGNTIKNVISNHRLQKGA